jgi:hypothetical protein
MLTGKNNITTTLQCFRFQPFCSRQDVDEVVGLTFHYDASLLAKLKSSLAVYCVDHKYETVGGWLAKYRCWFVDAEAWETIKLELLFLGDRIVEGTPR